MRSFEYDQGDLLPLYGMSINDYLDGDAKIMVLMQLAFNDNITLNGPHEFTVSLNYQDYPLTPIVF